MMDGIMDIGSKVTVNYSEIAGKYTFENVKSEDQYVIMNESRWQQSELVQGAMFLNETLQHSPLSPELSYMFLLICLVFMIPQIYLHSLIIKMTRRETKKNKQPMLCKALKGYAIALPVFQLICGGYTHIIIPHMYPPAETIGSWFCFSIEYIYHYFVMYGVIFSLLVGVMKYLWIVHNDKMIRVGETKAISLLLMSHFAIPLVLSFVNLVSNGNKDHVNVVDQCWGNTEQTENDENGVLDYFCYYRRYQIKEYIGENAGNFFEPVLRVTCGCMKIFYFLSISNIIEFVVYFYLWKHLNG